jgi:small subunit ribosomal protein S20
MVFTNILIRCKVRKYHAGRVVYLGKLGFLLVFSGIGLTFAVLNLEFMANHKATKKDVRQANKRRDRNRYYGKTTRNAIRDLRAIKGGKEAGEQLPEVASMIDKLAKKGVIHKNKAANLKSKLARKVNGLNATATAAK